MVSSGSKLTSGIGWAEYLVLVSIALFFIPFANLFSFSFDNLKRSLAFGGYSIPIAALVATTAAYILYTYAARLNAAAALFVGFLPIAAYLRGAGIDLPLYVAVYYAIALISIGQIVFKMIDPEWDSVPVEAWLIVGACTFVPFVGLLSVFHQVDIIAFGWILAAIGPITISFSNLRDRIGIRSVKLNALHFFAALFGLVYLGRTAVFHDSDSKWYGYNIRFELVDNGSIFSPTGYINPVHYYPKFYEILRLPLAYFSDPAYQTIFGILLLALSAGMIFRLIRTPNVSNVTAFLLTAVAITTPGLLYVSLGAKGDVLAYFLLVFGISSLFTFLRTRDSRFGVMACIGFLIPVLVKIGFLFFSATGFLVAAILLIRCRSFPKLRFALPVLFLAGLSAVVVIFRTWLLTGVPIVGPRPLIKLAQMLGFQPSDLIVTSMNILKPSGVSYFKRFVDWFFLPMNMSPMAHLMWVSLYPLVFVVFAIAIRISALGEANTGRRIEQLLVWSLVAISVAMQFLMSEAVYGGGGYYYVPGLSMSAIGLGIAIDIYAPQQYWSRLRKVLLNIFLSLVILFHCFNSFYGNWMPGFGRFDLSFTISVNWLEKENARAYRYFKIEDIVKHITPERGCRVFVARNVKDQFSPDILPCRVESTSTVSWRDDNVVPVLSSEKAFTDYLCWSKTRFILVTPPGIAPPYAPIIQPVIQRSELIVSENNYLLYSAPTCEHGN